MAAPAAVEGKGKRKRPLSEDDVYLLLHRSVLPPSASTTSSSAPYAPGTILTALQEVAQHAEGRRIDWRAVVAKSATGITSAREYQMLWRHFAYNHDLYETVDADDQPLGDDSDLELEPEPVPNPTKEALSEASALAKRWALISKRPGGSAKPASTKHVTVTSSEERKDALKALSMAVGPRSSSMLRPGAHQQGIQNKSTVFAHKIPEVKSAAAPSPAVALPVPLPVPVPVPLPLPVKVQVKSPLPQGQQAPVQRAPSKSANASNKTRKKQAAQPNPTIGPSSIQAAALAAGGRIAPASTAASFLAQIRSQVTGSSKSSASPKAPSLVVEPGTQPGSTQDLEPLSTSALKSGPSVLTTHATEQVRGGSEVDAAGAHSLDTKKTLGTTPVLVSCDSEETEDDSTFCVITIDDLFPEDAKEPETVDLKAKQPEIADQKAKQPVEIVGQRVKQLETVDPKAKQPETLDHKAKQPETADPKVKQPETVDPKVKQPDTLNPKVEIVDPKDRDMLEFDQFVASQGSVNTDQLDKSKNGSNALQAQGLAGSQKKQVKPAPSIGKGNPISSGVPVKGIKSPAPHLVTPVPAATPLGIVGTVNANAPNKTLVRKAATPAPSGVQAPPLKKHAANVKGNQALQPSAAAVGSGVPASSQPSVAVNGAGKANPPSNSAQASTVVNIGSKANPPSNGQASAAVNVGSNVNRPSSGQASVAVNDANRAANPVPSSQAGTAASGAANKVNPPGVPKQ
nr:unnamed protein product [Digitaria exilis]